MRGERIDLEAVKNQIAPCFIEVEGRRTDTVVLACTHYPFLIAALEKLAAWPVEWLDPAPAVARRVASVTEGRPISRGGPTIALFTGGEPPVALLGVLAAHGIRHASGRRFDISPLPP
jgi:glutamate racemase